MTIYAFTTILDPVGRAYNANHNFPDYATGLNDTGQIVGDYFGSLAADGQGEGVTNFGYLLSGGTYTRISDPSAATTSPANGTFTNGINDAGEIVGYYVTGGGVKVGFTLQSGVYTDVTPVSGHDSEATGINDAGQIVGWSTTDNSHYDGYILANSVYQTFDFTHTDSSVAAATYPEGINSAGMVVGHYADTVGATTQHGFIFSNGVFTTLDVPGATTTEAFGINEAGDVVGLYTDANSHTYGFTWSHGVYSTFSDPSEATGGGRGTFGYDINDAGQVVGSYYPSGFIGAFVYQYGYIASPIPDSTISQPNDFNGDRSNDILWHNAVTGEVDTWFINNGQYSGGSVVGNVSNAWQAIGVADFNHDGTSDILWRNGQTGEIDTWLIKNGQLDTSYNHGGFNLGSVSSAWEAAGTGDFNGDGTSDILWLNTQNGEVDTWLVNNGQYSGGSAIGHVLSAWQPAGVGDFNNDGTSDILWRNTATGEVDTWLLSNGQYAGGSAIGNVSSAWQALAVGDFNGDGTKDVLWQNSVTGEVDTWFLSNGHYAGGTDVGTVSSPWHFAGVGDYNHDGTTDILWRNTTTGEVDTWLISNGQISGGTALNGNVSSAWHASTL